MANRLLTQLRRFLAYCRDQGWVDTNVLEGVSRRNVGGKERAKDRHLSFAEIEAFLCFLADDSHRLSAGTRWALYGCLLTGLRATDVLTLSDTGQTHTKMQRTHRVPMTHLVRFWLAHRPTPLPRDHRVLSQALRDRQQDFTTHDLCRLWRSARKSRVSPAC